MSSRLQTRTVNDIKVPEGYTIQEYIFDYKNDLQDDDIFQKILSISENIDEYDADMIRGSLGFIYEKIEHLENIQVSFNLENCGTRFKEINSHLDFKTIETEKPSNFGFTVSVMLDLLYSLVNIFETSLEKVL